jgi:integrase/recombinase XerD
MKQAVTILKQVKLDSVWKRCSVAFTRSGSIKADVVLVGDKEIKVEGGIFLLDWYEHGKRIRLSVGKDAADALAAKQRKEAELKHVANGGSGLVNGAAIKTAKIPLKDAIAAFLEKKKLEQRKKTYQAYRTALTYFQHSCHKIFIQDVDDMDLSRFKKVLEDGGMEYTDYAGNKQLMKAQSERSVYNKREVVTFLLKEYKVTRADGKPILRGTDRIKPRSDKHKAYRREEVEALLAACDSEEKMYFQFFLLTGVREQEAAHLTWENVDLRHRLVNIRDNPKFGFKLKTQAAHREIPMGNTLHDMLRDWKAGRDTECGIVFPTAGCRPKLDFLDCLKRVAIRAKVKNVTLHRWRATFATWAHRSGIDARTIQKMMGHENLETTMLYLASLEGNEAISKANAFETYAGL